MDQANVKRANLWTLILSMAMFARWIFYTKQNWLPKAITMHTCSKLCWMMDLTRIIINGVVHSRSLPFTKCTHIDLCVWMRLVNWCEFRHHRYVVWMSCWIQLLAIACYWYLAPSISFIWGWSVDWFFTNINVRSFNVVQRTAVPGYIYQSAVCLNIDFQAFLLSAETEITFVGNLHLF